MFRYFCRNQQRELTDSSVRSWRPREHEPLTFDPSELVRPFQLKVLIESIIYLCRNDVKAAHRLAHKLFSSLGLHFVNKWKNRYWFTRFSRHRIVEFGLAESGEGWGEELAM